MTKRNNYKHLPQPRAVTLCPYRGWDKVHRRQASPENGRRPNTIAPILSQRLSNKGLIFQGLRSMDTSQLFVGKFFLLATVIQRGGDLEEAAPSSQASQSLHAQSALCWRVTSRQWCFLNYAQQLVFSHIPQRTFTIKLGRIYTGMWRTPFNVDPSQPVSRSPQKVEKTNYLSRALRSSLGVGSTYQLPCLTPSLLKGIVDTWGSQREPFLPFLTVGGSPKSEQVGD